MPKRRPRFALDANYIVALLLDSHEFHQPTLEDYESRLVRREVPVVPVHSLAEAFSVMTRMPAPYRLTGTVAAKLLERNFARVAEVPDLTGRAMWDLVAEFGASGLSGGLIYGAMIARSACEAGASVIVTWNMRDMLRVAPAGLEVHQPVAEN